MPEAYRFRATRDGADPVVGTAWFARLDRVITSADVAVEGAALALVVGEDEIALNIVVRDTTCGLAVLEPAGSLAEVTVLPVGARPAPLAEFRAPGFPNGGEGITPHGTIPSVEGDSPRQQLELSLDKALDTPGGWIGAPVIVGDRVVGVVTEVDGDTARAAEMAPLAAQLGLQVAQPPPPQGTRLERMRRVIDNNKLIATLVAVLGALAGVLGNADRIIDFVKEYVIGETVPMGEILVTTDAAPLLQAGVLSAETDGAQTQLAFNQSSTVVVGTWTVRAAVDQVTVAERQIAVPEDDAVTVPIDPRYDVLGRVYDPDEDTPYAGVTVRIGESADVTVDDGSFILQGLPMEAVYRIEVFGGPLDARYSQDSPWRGNVTNSQWASAVRYNPEVRL